ncbi:hypothetical protein, partial [Legionella beliardensis]
MKKLTTLLLICLFPLMALAGEQRNIPGLQDMTKSSFEQVEKTSVDQARNTTSLSATGFSAASNSADDGRDAADDEETNIHLKSSTHMGDVLNQRLPVFGRNLFGRQCEQLHQARFFNPE